MIADKAKDIKMIVLRDCRSIKAEDIATDSYLVKQLNMSVEDIVLSGCYKNIHHWLRCSNRNYYDDFQEDVWLVTFDAFNKNFVKSLFPHNQVFEARKKFAIIESRNEDIDALLSEKDNHGTEASDSILDYYKNISSMDDEFLYSCFAGYSIDEKGKIANYLLNYEMRPAVSYYSDLIDNALLLRNCGIKFDKITSTRFWHEMAFLQAVRDYEWWI